jgi:hypothetical protein
VRVLLREFDLSFRMPAARCARTGCASHAGRLPRGHRVRNVTLSGRVLGVEFVVAMGRTPSSREYAEPYVALRAVVTTAPSAPSRERDSPTSAQHWNNSTTQSRRSAVRSSGRSGRLGANDNVVLALLRRGLRKCPHGGQGRLFSGWPHLEPLFNLRLGGLPVRVRSAPTVKPKRAWITGSRPRTTDYG